MADVRIFTSKNCGWAVRNYASLLEKGVEFETVCPLDASGNKTAEFIAATPLQKTPVLVHGETCVFESTLINLYIDDCFADPPLLPDNPAQRIEAHKWIHFAEVRLMRSFSEIANATTLETRRIAVDKVNTDFNWIAEHVLHGEWAGPFIFGKKFSLTDIAYFTVFRTLRQLEDERQAPIAELGPTLTSWERNVMERPSIRQAVNIQNNIPF